MMKPMKDIPWRRVALALAIGIAMVCAWLWLRDLAGTAFPESPALVRAVLGLVFWISLFKFCITPIGEALRKRPGPR